MAEPSLGYAIGLNVKRQDIFAPAAKQLSQNLANWKAEKAQAKREKDAEASKFMSEVMRFSPDEFHVKTRPDAYKFFNAKLAKVESLLDNPDGSAMDQLRLLGEIRDGLASFKDQSKGFQNTDQQILTDAKSVPKPLRTFMATPGLIPTEDQQAMFEIYEVGYDKDSNRVLSTGPKMFDVRAEIAAPTADAMLAAADPKKLKEAQQVIKMKTGYDPLAFTELTPDKLQYLLSLGNVMERPGALGSIIEELIDKKFSGNDTKFYEFLNAEMNKQKAAATDPTAPLPTARDIAKAAATQYMLDVHLPLYQTANAKILNLNKTNDPSGSSNKNESKRNPAAATAEGHLSTAGKALAKRLGMDEQTAINIVTNRISATPEQRRIANQITYKNILGEGPTVSFNTGGTEVVTIGFGNINPRKLWYDQKKNKFHLSYDKQVSGEGTSYNLAAEDKVLTWEELKQLDSSGNSNVKAQLEQWDLNAAENKVPSISNYILSKGSVTAAAAPSGSGSSPTTFPWGGTGASGTGGK
jgi:hypothetical protein